MKNARERPCERSAAYVMRLLLGRGHEGVFRSDPGCLNPVEHRSPAIQFAALVVMSTSGESHAARGRVSIERGTRLLNDYLSSTQTIQAYRFPLKKMPGFTVLTARRYTGFGGQDIPALSGQWTLTGELRKLSHTVQQTRRSREITSISHFDVYVKLGPEGATQSVNQGMQAMARAGGPDICAEFVVVRRSDDGRWLVDIRVVV